MVMHLWQEDAASPLQSVHFGFALGAVIVPQIVRPFIDEETYPVYLPTTSNTSNTANLQQSLDGTNDDAATDDVTTQQMLTNSNALVAADFNAPSPMESAQNNVTATDTSSYENAYYIVGGIEVLVAVVTLPVFLYAARDIGEHRHGSSFRQMFTITTCASTKSVGCAFYTFICLFIYFGNIVGIERALAKYIYAYLVSDLVRMKKSSASNIVTTFWSAFAFGRLLGIYATKVRKLNVQIIFNNIMYLGFVIAFFWSTMLLMHYGRFSRL